MLDSLLCLVNRHRPADRRADWNGETFVSRCGTCHQPIRRAGKGRWIVGGKPKAEN
ncbi:hypothetical protein [Aurantiacibacter hainanensis]|uniref:hypothetical protein n=1 Tax=Aurantiacibacter hainanensis TaxID=3076114 RepID=UPI0030C740E2